MNDDALRKLENIKKVLADNPDHLPIMNFDLKSETDELLNRVKKLKGVGSESMNDLTDGMMDNMFLKEKIKVSRSKFDKNRLNLGKKQKVNITKLKFDVVQEEVINKSERLDEIAISVKDDLTKEYIKSFYVKAEDAIMNAENLSTYTKGHVSIILKKTKNAKRPKTNHQKNILPGRLLL